MQPLLQGALIGVIATLAMDLWAALAKHVLSLPTTNWVLVGRWFGHMPSGVLTHRSITAAAPVAGELAIGWVAHYAIGIVYGVAYLLIARALANTLPLLVIALGFALAALVFPWFVLQPALGGGILARKTARPNLLRLVSVSMHTAFGIGLYVGTRLIAE